MQCALHAVEKICAPPAGGLKSIVLIDPDDLAMQPNWYALPNIADLDWSPGAEALAFEADRVSASLTDDTSTGARHGDYYEYRLQATVRGIRLDVDWLRAKLLNRRIHVAVTMHNDLQRVIPYMRLSANSNTGAKVADRNQYSFTGTARLLQPAPFIDATLTGGGTGGGGEVTPPETGVSPVVISTSASTYTYTVPAGQLLLAVYVRSNSAQSVSLGTTPGGAELNGGPIDLDANQYGLFGSALLRPVTNTPIYLSGLAGTNIIEIWLLG